MEEIKSVDRLRKELIANVSHDLRTPLSTIQGYAETLQLKHDSLTPEAQQRYLGTIVKATGHMKQLVEDLFELSKLESNQVQTNFERFNIAELVSDNMQRCELLAREKGVELVVDIPDGVPEIYADIALIDRVLQNLLDNALKHTDAGGSVTLAA